MELDKAKRKLSKINLMLIRDTTSFTETMVTFGEKENAINAYIFMKTKCHALSIKTFHFCGSFL